MTNMCRNFVLCILVLFYISTLCLTKDLPASFPRCKLTDPNLSECLLNATITVRPFLAGGIAELGIPPIEPLNIPMVKLEQGTQAVNYKATLTNVNIRGLGKYRFKDIDFVSIGPKHYNIRGNVDIGEVKLVCDYIIMGRALLLPIRGNGVFTANFSNAKGEIDMSGMVIRRKGEEYYQNHETMIKIQIGKAKANFDNLFDGDKTLSKVTNEFLNMHAKDIVDEVKPAVESVIGMIVDDIANKIFDSVPFRKLFPVD